MASRFVVVLAALVHAVQGALPVVPGAKPFFTAGVTADGVPSFSVTNSTRFKNRPLYGPHNSGLVLTGDRPLTHLANDHTVFGGLLIGVLRDDGVGVWAHDADAIASTYEGGAMHWAVSDSHLPGVTLSLRVLPAATGLGFVCDANVTTPAGVAATLVWAHGCAAASKSSQNIGWQFDPLINADTLSWSFTPRDCAGNRVTLTPNASAGYSIEFDAGAHAVNVTLACTATTTLVLRDADGWSNISSLAGTSVPPLSSSYHAAPPLPVAGASLWLRASSLAHLSDGAPVAAWTDESGASIVVAQAVAALQPRFRSAGLATGDPAVVFDGEGTFLRSAAARVGNASTIFAVLRDDGSTGGDGCCSGVVFFGDTVAGGCNGIATLPAMADTDDDDNAAAPGTAIVTKLDYAGSDANGRVNVRGRIIAAASSYAATGPSAFYVDGCEQGTRPLGGTPGVGVMLGARNNELRRFFRGALAEVVVYDRALDATEMTAMWAYFAAAHPAMPPKRSCTVAGPLAVGRTALPPVASTRLTWLVSEATPAAAAADPLAALAAAAARVAQLTQPVAVTPDALVNAALRSLGPAVDGLFRDDPPAFVHGAMAWDELYLGWRSEYGATVLGRSDLVALEGAYFFARQDSTSPADAACVSDAAYLLTKEAPASRFYGRGHISQNSGMYDMQSQFFDQQLHMWRWTGNATHEALLRPALALHAEWAAACFDANRDGLYASYINTWPTDSQWYNGGETVEETSYIYRVQLALRDMALRAGDAQSAAAAAAAAAQTAAAFDSLWVVADGHPAAFREEGGHRRLRPDAWLYSIFLPIEAGLLSQEQAAQALYYTEWGLERDAIPCDESPNSAACGEVVWTSNWVPSQWSVRQLWSGDVSGLALAYYFAGLPDDGWRILSGNLHRDMLQGVVPGQTGGTNAGTDFNDSAHPLTRAIVEGLFGYRPDNALGVVTLAPQFPSSWPSASLSTVEMTLSYAVSDGTAQLQANLAQPAPRIVVRVPICAAAVGAVVVASVPTGAPWSLSIEGGFGQAVAVVSINGTAAAPLSSVSVTVPFSGALPCNASMYAAAHAGQAVALRAPDGVTLVRVSDPQGILNGSGNVNDGELTGVIAGSVQGSHMLIGYATTASGLPQVILFKLNVTAPAQRSAFPPPALAAASSWRFADVAPNADMGVMFAPGTYLSPRPQTCGVRIGTDGFSAWTFPYFHISPRAPTFSALANLSIGGGVIATPQGAQFLLNGTATGVPNILFASLWDNYPPAVTVPLAPAPGATTAWVLVAGSTNPMQTLLTNAVLRFVYADGAVEELELVPPMNFWALSGWGNADYSYETDAFCLPPTPPPTVQLGDANRAMVYAHTIREGGVLASVQLEVLSQEVVIGILAVSLMLPAV